MKERVKQIMADVLDLDANSIDGRTTVDGTESWDSLKHITLCLNLEEAFGVSLSVEEMETMLSYEDIVRVLNSKL